MGKTHRGKGLKDQVSQGRGVCPICKRTGVKVVFEAQVKDKTIKVCKTCKASIAHGKMVKEVEAVTAGAEAQAPAAS
jgi:hypothetical protein